VASASPSPDAVTRGGTLRVAQATDIASLDPWTSSDDDTLMVLRQVFETLVDLEPGGFGVVPRLADRWTSSSDGRVWTFHLRPNVHFHDGTVFDAAAVAFNFDRARSFARFDLGAILSSVDAPDPSTVVFTLRSAYAPFLATLASPSFGIVSPACVRQGPVWTTPATRCAAGTGPFKLETGGWKPGDRITLSRNTTYWGRDADSRVLPFLDAVTFQAVRDEDSRAGALKAAAIDLALDLGPASVRAVRGDPNIGPARRPVFDTSYLGVASGVRPFDVVEVRRALAMAVDRGALLTSVYGGDARMASQLVPPGLLGYDDSITAFTATDAAAAKRLLADAGLGAGFAADLWYAPDFSTALPDPKRVADAIAADLAKIGITVTVRSEEQTRLDTDIKAGAVSLWVGALAPARADPDDFFAGATASSVATELLRRARGEPDASKRAELYKQVTKLLQQEITRIPLVHANAPIGLSRKVQGFVPQPVVGESLATAWFGR
jgi:peptide/nickel transport system substrate-binding protein